MRKKYIVRVTEEERRICDAGVGKLKGSEPEAATREILLQTDVDGPGRTDRQVAVAYRCRTRTVENVWRRCVLETCERPYDAQQPVVCIDEQPVQLVKDTRESVPATENHPQRKDCEYKRAGTAAVFLFCEPLSGWRQGRARERRTKTDWVYEVADLLEGRYAGCGKVTLVLDNLNTHTKGAFHTAFEPERARELVRRIEFCYTPKHGSWLNIAECELNAMTRQCLSGAALES